jgi:hypothetical protein
MNTTKTVRFIKNFVLFLTEVKSIQGKLVSEQVQHHITFGQIHRVVNFEPQSENSVLIEFADDDPFSGTTTIDKSYVELQGGGTRLSDPCCKDKD